MSLTILGFLSLGVVLGLFLPAAVADVFSSASTWMLLILIFSVGIDLGVNKEVFAQIRRLGVKILLVPFGVIAGSIFGGIVGAVILQDPILDGMVITSGLGWYSLPGIMITDAGRPILGTTTFLANCFREVISFVTIPLIAVHLNHYTAIAPPGAAAMDTSLPVVRANTDAETAVVSFVSGATCTIAVPLLIGLLLG